MPPKRRQISQVRPPPEPDRPVAPASATNTCYGYFAKEITISDGGIGFAASSWKDGPVLIVHATVASVPGRPIAPVEEFKLTDPDGQPNPLVACTVGGDRQIAGGWPIFTKPSEILPLGEESSLLLAFRSKAPAKQPLLLQFRKNTYAVQPAPSELQFQLTFLKHPDPEVRLKVVRSLGTFRADIDEKLSALKEALNQEKDPQVRAEIDKVISNIAKW